MSDATGKEYVGDTGAISRVDGAAYRVVLTCEKIMSLTTIVGILLLVIGAVMSRAGLVVGALLVFNAWLLWPAGAVACGVAALALKGVHA